MMISEDKLKSIIKSVMDSLGGSEINPSQNRSDVISDNEVVDFAAGDIRDELFIEDPANRDALMRMKKATPARLGIGRCGPRYKTKPQLRFRADHATAMDAVFNNICLSFLEEWGGILQVHSRCTDRDQHLTRPDLGRQLTEESVAILKSECKSSPTVQIVVSDGLSSTAVEANARDVYEALVQGLKGHNIDIGTTLFVHNGRVPVMDIISELLTPEVTILLVGERPGLATAESLSCYMAYKGSTSMPESGRTVVSNIHNLGTPAVEAGAQIADIAVKMLQQKASGIDLKL